MDAAIGGGIANGIDSFVSSYRATKQQQFENALKQRLADIEGAKAYGSVLGEGGSDYANPILPSLIRQPQQPSQPQQPQSDYGLVKQAPLGLTSPDSGLMGPAVAAQQPQPPAPSGPYIPSKFQRSIMSHYLEANDKEGQTGIHYGYDPRTGQVTKSNVPLNPLAQKELDLKTEEVNNAKFGQRSANAAVNNQYGDAPATQAARGSQINMAQMVDNYKNPSPQGDASLLLNAFKIKFPKEAPNVNSIEELQKSQSAQDSFRSEMSKLLQGGFDQATRDNLMRDAVSTFRANVGSLKGEQKKALLKSKQAGINGSLITSEPSVDQTYADAMDIQNKIGPYVPPSQRGGISSAIAGKLSGLLGVTQPGSRSTAKPSGPAPGSIVNIKGKGRFRVGQDGDSLEPVQ